MARSGQLCGSPAAAYSIPTCGWGLPLIAAPKHACVQPVRSMAKHPEGGGHLLFFRQRRRIHVLLSALIRNVEFLLFGCMSLGS